MADWYTCLKKGKSTIGVGGGGELCDYENLGNFARKVNIARVSTELPLVSRTEAQIEVKSLLLIKFLEPSSLLLPLYYHAIIPLYFAVHKTSIVVSPISNNFGNHTFYSYAYSILIFVQRSKHVYYLNPDSRFCA